MKNIRAIFMGTPEFAVPILKSLIANLNVIMVVTQPDKEVGRHHEIQESPIKKLALESNIKVVQPIKIRNDYTDIINAHPDIIITCAYGQIIPKIILDEPKYGCINVHASFLPELRGGAPLQHAIIDGYNKTGITIMYMAEGMDDGDIISQMPYEIKPTDTYGDLVNNLSNMGVNLLLKTLPDIFEGTNKRIKQDQNHVTFAHIIKREEEHISFTNSGIVIDRLVRGLNPEPYANTIINNIEIKIISGYFVPGISIPNKINVINKDTIGIGCLDGIYYITELKPAGKRIMKTKEFLNGIDKEKLKTAIIK
jgi:methionyl-tRNA formyltransferase